MSGPIVLHPLAMAREIRPGDDLAEFLVAAMTTANLAPERHDVLVVTQKVVSKSEDRFVDLCSVIPGKAAIELAKVTQKDARFVDLVLAESTAVVRAVPNILITRHRSGHVMANAGIDRSNVGPDGDDLVLLLPADSDASAERLRAALAARWPAPPAVLISDSFGRPWRQGVTNVAIGAAGLPTLVDRRGDLDRDGRKLQVTQVGFGDMVASASGLAMGEGAENVPAVLVRGLRWMETDRPASALVRPPEEDLFR
jgi:coenzyme F420-0:L-glutamate ligase/coenzyme F420-1:gamma-L-glutamate ligase